VPRYKGKQVAPCQWVTVVDDGGDADALLREEHGFMRQLLKRWATTYAISVTSDSSSLARALMCSQAEARALLTIIKRGER